jgi:hypothetical protein
MQEGDTDIAMIWCGGAADLISDVPAATELVWRIGAEAETCLRSGNGLLDEMGSARRDSNLRPSDTD